MTDTITAAATTSLDRKIDFAVVFSVGRANPNGDPLNMNEPRTFGDENLGEVTAVALKRKVRDRLLESGAPIFVQSARRTSDGAVNLKERLDASIPTKASAEAKFELACKTWLDVRAFGQLLAHKGKKNGAESEESLSIGIRGPVSVHSAYSLEPITIKSTQITKSVSFDGDGTKPGSDQMGMTHYLEDDAIYVFYGAMNPQLAERTGFSYDDAQAIKAVLPRMFENDASSSRPEGSMEVKKVVWWEHDSKLGRMSSAKLHGSLQVDKKSGDVKVPDFEGVKVEVIDGF